MKPCVLSHIVLMSLMVTAVATMASAGTEKILFNFNGSPHGDQPNGGLISDAAGNLYGVTEFGGSIGYGGVYKVSPNGHGGWTQNMIYSFGTNGAANPQGSLVLDGAGNLYGIGGSGDGTIFELTPKANGTWSESVHWSFTGKNGADPVGGLIFDSAGNLYGAGEGGGSKNCGEVFELSPGTGGKWSENTLYSFQCGNDGSGPSGALIFDESGNLYGAAGGGGTAGDGVVYELTPASGGTWKEQVLYSFIAGSGGYGPSGKLVFDKAGDIFGAAGGGVSTACFRNPCGLVFELTTASNGVWTESVVHDFNETDGAYPEGSLVIDGKGNLYGTAIGGGTASPAYGTVFELSPGTGGEWSEKTLWNFSGGKDGASPEFGVILGSAGQVYGTTKYYGGLTGNGTVFELTATQSGPWNESTLSSFPDGNGGPTTGLTADGAGNFYGATNFGGANGFGVVYEVSPKSNGGWKVTIVYNFTTGLVSDGRGFGASPSNLIFDASGNLYGEIGYGGASGNGSVYELSPAAGGSWVEKDLYDFNGGTDGTMPLGGLVFDAAGNLYGTTELGGNGTGCHVKACGTVFELAPSGGSWTKTILYNFQGGTTDGADPEWGVVFDKAGNLYGTTQFGGSSGVNCGSAGCGSLFEVSPSAGGWKETFVYLFTQKNGDGASPFAGLIIDGAGNLYGTTGSGGAHGSCGAGCGTVFEFSPMAGGGLKETVIYSFASTAAYGPDSPLVLDSAGNLYGTTQTSVFEVSPAAGGGWTETTLYLFAGPGSGDGYDTYGGLVLDGAGNLYGTAANGGSSNGGTVYEITP